MLVSRIGSRLFATIKELLQDKFKAVQHAKENIRQSGTIDRSKMESFIESLKQTKQYSKPLNKRQIALYDDIISFLIEKGETGKLLQFLPQQNGRLQTEPILKKIQSYLIDNKERISGYQACLASYWMSRYRFNGFRNSIVNQIQEKVKQIQERQMQTEAGILFTYSQLIDGFKIKEQPFPLVSLVPAKGKSDFQYCRQAKQINLYLFPDPKPAVKCQASQKLQRSKLEQQLECTLSALDVKFERQINVLDTYTIDAKYGDTYIDIHGPSHFMPWGALKGQEIVRQKVLKKNGFQYKSISHKEWSQLKGIRGRIAFLKYFLAIN